MKVYTKTGDTGMTSLIGGTRVSKSDLRLEAYGTADELNSFIGNLRAEVQREQSIDAEMRIIDGRLEEVQNDLFCLGGYLALDQNCFEPRQGTIVKAESISDLEKWIDEMESELPVLHSFVIPGGSEAVSRCHICRTVCRRLERAIVTLFGEKVKMSAFDENALQYVNRLSDFLFILSKKIAKIEKNELFLWKN